VLLGEAPDEIGPLTANEAGTETVWLVAREQSKYWKSVDPKACEPQEGAFPNLYVQSVSKNHDLWCRFRND